MNIKMIAWRLKNAAFRFVTPMFWAQNQPTCYRYDAELRRALDAYPIKKIGDFTCDLGGVEIWINNYPYAYGAIGIGSDLPAPLTRRRLRRLVRQKRLEVKIEAWQ